MGDEFKLLVASGNTDILKLSRDFVPGDDNDKDGILFAIARIRHLEQNRRTEPIRW
jgi:hypothetical protein